MALFLNATRSLHGGLIGNPISSTTVSWCKALTSSTHSSKLQQLGYTSNPSNTYISGVFELCQSSKFDEDKTENVQQPCSCKSIWPEEQLLLQKAVLRQAAPLGCYKEQYRVTQNRTVSVSSYFNQRQATHEAASAASRPTSGVDKSFSGSDLADSSPVFTYHAPLSRTLLRLKRVSLFTCFGGVLSGPIIVALDTSTAMASKLGIGAVMALFGVFTTSLLHWFTSPYVHELQYDRATEKFKTERLSFFTRPIHNTFPLSAVKYADSLRPQTTFSAEGELYYLDKDNFGDDELFKQLDKPAPNIPPNDTPADQTQAAPEAPR